MPAVSKVKLLPKSEALLQMLYLWQLDDDMRRSLLGPSVPVDYQTCINFYDATYDGISKQLIGIADGDGVLYGAIMLHIEYAHRRCELHLLVDEKHRGRGTLRAMKALFNYVFNDLRLERLYTFTPEDNPLAVKGMKNIGATEVSFIPNYYFAQDHYCGAHILEVTSDSRRI